MILHPEFWVAVAFFVLLGFGLRPASRKIVGLLDQHREKIKEQLEESHLLHEQARELLADYKQQHIQTMNEIENIQKLAEDEVLRMKDRFKMEMEETLQRRVVMLDERIKQLQQQALVEVKDQVASVALQATQRVLREAAGETMQEDTIKQNLKDIKNILH